MKLLAKSYAFSLFVLFAIIALASVSISQADAFNAVSNPTDFQK